ncbi:hypothetical protein AVEN_189161-1 [Araneus ventricosus]|uniref:Uncharacterized protein n=1 Tax=Araneus ventricosus TaxID=182803 RepID=A0A4Y2W7B8_ARAVE|nr:hypothetical protein AVEN_189161-1 [Araneus ventricosus]
MPVSFYFTVPNKSRPPQVGGGALSPPYIRRVQAGPVWVFLHHIEERTFGPLHMGWRATDPIHDGPSVESGFEPGTLRHQGQDLNTRPPWSAVTEV